MAAARRPAGPRTPAACWIALAILVAGAVGTQAALDGRYRAFAPATGVLWVRSPQVMQRLVLDFDALAADVYWVRAVQYYGGTKLSKAHDKNYDLLYPLLDMTTTLDPRFNIAYRFGAILLSEGYPNGLGDPKKAIALLEKGLRETPDRWQYALDAGFIEYWWHRDNEAAADWFLRASAMEGAPNWLQPLAARVVAEAGSRDEARLLWTQVLETADQDWLRDTARRSLLQLDAETQIEQLQELVNRYYDRAGRFPGAWEDMARAGIIPGTPLDPSGHPYVVDPVSGTVDVAQASPLFPLRRGQTPAREP